MYKEDIGSNKAETLIDRINFNYGYDWRYIPEYYSDDHLSSNIVIIAVDNINTRLIVYDKFFHEDEYSYSTHEHDDLLYLIDTGNDLNSGQVTLSSKNIKQPKMSFKTVSKLPSPIEIFGNEAFKQAKKEEVNIPSCSAREAILKQDPMINRYVANVAVDYLWRLIHQHIIHHNASFISINEGIKHLKLK